MKNRPVNFLIILLLLLFVSLPAGSFALSIEPPPDFPLLEAVKKGDMQKIKAILGETTSDAGKDEVNKKGHSGDMPLSVAARRGNLEMVKLLIEHGAVVDGGKETGDRTALIAAAGQGHAEVVQYLIAKGADVNAKGNGLTALLAALTERFSPFGPTGDPAKTIRILLENGADVNIQDESWLKTGRTPLMYAVLQADTPLVQSLLAKGARLDLKNKDGDTALSLAQKDGLTYIAQLLEKAGSSGAGSSPQPDRSLHPLFNAVTEGSLNKVKVLLAKGADVNLRNINGSTPLMFAADGNKPAMVRHLLKSGADVNAKNGTNNTALIYASIKGHDVVVKELLKGKADVKVKNIGKGDALVYAGLHKKTEVVRVLLNAGASVNEKYDDGKTALIMAVQDGSSDIVKLLISHKADVNVMDNNEMTALMLACEKGNADIVQALVKAGADINKKSKYGDTALHKAISANHIQIVRALVKNSANYNKQEALYSAVQADNLEIVKLLLTKDTDVNMRFYAGGTLLMFAADKDLAIVKLLTERGADVNKKDDEGKTALMKAVESFHETNISSVKYFIEQGADVNAVNNNGETALILSAKRGNAEMVKALVAKGNVLSSKDKKGKSAWSYAMESTNSAVMNLLENAGATRDYLGLEWKGNLSNQKAEFIKVVETQEEWAGLWKRAFDKPAPGMDFEKYSVACVFLGHSAQWLYSIGLYTPALRGNQRVITYALHDVKLSLSGPFRAGGQYAMKVFEKKKDVKMILEENTSFPRSR